MKEGLQVRTAQMLDPLSPVTSYWHARYLLYARRAEDAIEESRRALNLDPDFAYGLSILGRALLLQEMARRRWTRCGAAPRPGIEGARYLAYGLAATGRARSPENLESDRIPGEGADYVRSELLAAVYGALGERDAAFRQLERAYADRSAGLIYLHLDPMYDSLREDPRMDEMVRGSASSSTVSSMPSSKLPHRLSVVWFSDLGVEQPHGRERGSGDLAGAAFSSRRPRSGLRGSGSHRQVHRRRRAGGVAERGSGSAADELRGLMQAGDDPHWSSPGGRCRGAGRGPVRRWGEAAQRIQTVAQPGQIVVSGDVWRQLRNRPSYRFEPLGEQSLKESRRWISTWFSRRRTTRERLRVNSSKSATPEPVPAAAPRSARSPSCHS